MNTTRTGMRTVLAAAAAGALIMGSAAGAMAAKPESTIEGTMKVRMVNVHNGTFNLNSTTPVTVKAKVNVWDSVKKLQPESVTVTLTQYDAKAAKGGKPGGLSITSGLMSTSAGVDKKSKNYYTTIDLSTLKDKVSATPVLLCLSSVDLKVPAQVKLGDPKRQVTKKIGNDCITVVNTPAL